ncbi:uncharacterized protein LOC129573561 [Sitodiplosis mosellana]|uniref:uncharacterized protein LOC129573561 n=1 Tax=Sitodiplosis mosellana TaxID=263140 RepID=UPI00244418D9|nr:uncharacterized protein LOC129573561 [Sitodiplosis mosellana]
MAAHQTDFINPNNINMQMDRLHPSSLCIPHLFDLIRPSIGWELSNLTTPDIPLALAAVWDDYSQSLYFINMASSGMQSSIFRYSDLDGIFYSAYIEGVSAPSFIMPIKDECDKMAKCNVCGYRLFAVGVDHSVLIIKWNGKSTKAKVVSTLLTLEQNMPLSRTNFARADNKGRLYGGTLSRKFCNITASEGFYRYKKTAGVDLLFNGLFSTSGVVFNEDLNKIYQLDTCTGFIAEFDWDPKTGDIYILENALAKWFSGTGGLADVYDIKVPGISGMALGGPNRDIMYVIAGSEIVNVYSTAVVKQITEGTSIFVLRGIGAMGQPSTSLSIKGQNNDCNKCGSH